MRERETSCLAHFPWQVVRLQETDGRGHSVPAVHSSLISGYELLTVQRFTSSVSLFFLIIGLGPGPCADAPGRSEVL